jgi:hypothetical protein
MSSSVNVDRVIRRLALVHNALLGRDRCEPNPAYDPAAGRQFERIDHHRRAGNAGGV